MLQAVKELLRARGIEEAPPQPRDSCHVVLNYRLDRPGLQPGTGIRLAVPYYTHACDDPEKNISAYCVSADYHRFFAALFDEVLPLLRSAFPDFRFAGFTDHSPIIEGEAAARAGLGFLGCNHLFLTKKYSSFVFLGEIVTDAKVYAEKKEIAYCPNCGACRAACPVSLATECCLSALSQQKKPLSESEQKILKAHNVAFGCDICQEACPVTIAAKKAGTLYTNIRFFIDSALPRLTVNCVEEMSDEEFAARAYSWRGRAVILRNLRLLEDSQ